MDQRSWGLHRWLERAAVYERCQNLLGSDSARARFAREFLRARPGDRILDIGCGTATILTQLPTDVVYVGYDLNPRYIEAARRRFGSRGRFLCAQVGDSATEFPEAFDLVLAKGVLHHLGERSASALLASAHAALRPGGILVTIDPVRHPGMSRAERWLMALDRGQAIRTPEDYIALVQSRFPTVEARLLTDLVRVPYSHFVMRAAKGDADRGSSALGARA